MAVNVALPSAEKVMLGTAVGWVVGPWNQDIKPPKLQKTYLGSGMRHVWSITERIDMGITV